MNMKTPLKNINSRFKMNKVALATSAVFFGVLSSTQAMAQEEKKEKEIEVIQVSGIRGGIIAGLDVKRNSNNIIDAVSAEDMGKFPDANLAEALQRIPEVSIDRDGGEGRYITIRGLGPEFNQVLLNGRHIASNEASRAFSFDTIASELVSEMTVYKTQSAGLSEGGLGGTVNVKTARPLNFDGLNVVGSLKSVYEENAETTNPQGSFLISNTFLDGKVGALFGATYQERKNRTYQTDNGGVRTAGQFRGTNSFNGWENYTSGSYEGANTYRPIELNRNVIDENRKRLGINAVFQYQPNDRLNITVDYLYSKFDVTKTVNKKSNWLGGVYETPGQYQEVLDSGAPQEYADLVAASQTAIDSNGVFTHMTNGATAAAYNRLDFFRDTETQMLGANVEYKLNDDMQLTLDAAWSSSTQDNPGLDSRLSFETHGGMDVNVNTGASVPYVVNEDQSLIASDANAPSLLIKRHWFEGEDISAENLDLHADLVITTYNDITIRTGFAYEAAQKENNEYKTPFLAQRYMHTSGGAFTLENGLYEQLFNGVLNVSESDLGAPSDSNQDMYNIDRDAVISYINNPANWIDNGRKEYNALVANGGYGAPLTGNSWDVEETVTSAYIEGTYEFEIGDMEASLTGGLRYSHTEIDATGLSQILTDIQVVECPVQPSDATCLGPVFASTDVNDDGGSYTRDTVSTSYSNVLPSVNLNVHLTDDLILRLASSTSLTRPYLEDMAPKFRFKSASPEGNTAEGNNAGLTPYTSFNLDASLEWYFEEGAMASVALFSKKIDDYIIRVVDKDVIVDTIATGEYQAFNVFRPGNAEDMTVSGVSVNLTQSFESGFGYQFNYTMVDTDTEFDGNTFDPSKPALPGLGDSMNLVAFYENDDFSARIAYNKREHFLSQTQYQNGYVWGDEFGEAVITKDYSQIDARIGYEIADNITVFLEGINLTGETLGKTGRFDNIFISYENFGRRYVAGVSAKF